MGGAECRRNRTQEFWCSHWDIAWRGRACENIARDPREWRNRDDETQNVEDAERMMRRTQGERNAGEAERRRSRTQEIGCLHLDTAWSGRARENIARGFREWRNRDNETQDAEDAGRRIRRT